MSWMATLTDMREKGWVITALAPYTVEGLTEEEKKRLESAMVLAAYNLIDKMQEGKR